MVNKMILSKVHFNNTEYMLVLLLVVCIHACCCCMLYYSRKMIRLFVFEMKGAHFIVNI